MKTSENKECFLKETIETQARTLPVQKKMLQRNKVASFTEGTAALKKKKKRKVGQITFNKYKGTA